MASSIRWSDSFHNEFDEDDCREFLAYELGEEIPRLYRYARGIDEVRKRVILRYGDFNYGRAMGIFIQLLESEDCASGLGDTGDHWRSWRHDYKNRNEDLENPDTPHFPGLVLPAVVRPGPTYKSVPIVIPAHSHTADQTFIHQQSSDKVLILSGLSAGNVAATQTRHICPIQRAFGGRGKIQCRRAIEAKTLSSSKPIKTGSQRNMSQKISALFHKHKTQKVSNMSNQRERGNSHSENGHVAGQVESGHVSPMSLDGQGELDDNGNQDNKPQDTRHESEDSLQPLPLRLRSSVIVGQENRFPPHYSNSSSGQDKSPNTASTMYSRTTSSGNPSSTGSIQKDAFRGNIRDMLNPNGDILSPDSAQFLTKMTRRSSMTGHSSMFGNFSPLENLEPTKYNPTPTLATESEVRPESSQLYARYASVMNANPYVDRQITDHRPTFADEEARLRGYTPYMSPEKPRGLGLSRSEANVNFIAPTPIKTRAQNNGATVHFQDEEEFPDRGRVHFQEEEEYLDRGRERRRPSLRYLDQYKEELSPTPRRSRSPMKKMFGENGWLNRSTSMKEIPVVEHDWKSGFKQWGGKIKQRVEGITDDMTRLLPNPFNPDANPRTYLLPENKFPISLNPVTQGRFFSELELLICVTANLFLVEQRKEGRMSTESLVKVTDGWKTKGRPQVIEFQFDQGTQRDLILYNLKSFRFHGENAKNLTVINRMMYNWKTLAKEMSIRTFCSPDSVIRRHLHDAYPILELLGAPFASFLLFQDIQLRTLNLIRDEQQRRDDRLRSVNASFVKGSDHHYDHNGIERKWSPLPPIPLPAQQAASGILRRSNESDTLYDTRSHYES
ncbi:MAG: hypothetical protein M1816_004652 [Peltula sp. TS41687]|nr:MAG: hypothetical protein M1816_004652 [Peltula sp. TS41687]